jgi:two-component system, response regulator PdtaR
MPFLVEEILTMALQMQTKVLIVEDEFLVALHMQMMLTRLGFKIVGIAPDMQAACAFAEEHPDIALVDVNLRDGPTGPQIGAMLAQKFGASVLFITANPRQLSPAQDGPIGVISKPFNDNEVGPVLDFLVKHRQGEPTPPPPGVTLFDNESRRHA